MAIAVVLPSIVIHFKYADHRMPPLADRYAARVLAAVPANVVLLSGGFEFAQPLVYRQVSTRSDPT